jgi:hypothetical protein
VGLPEYDVYEFGVGNDNFNRDAVCAADDPGFAEVLLLGNF